MSVAIIARKRCGRECGV